MGAIIEDKDDPSILWIGTNFGLEKFNKITGEFTHFIHDPERPESIPEGQIGSIYDDENGKLWIGGFISGNGLTLFDKATEKAVNFRNNPSNPRSLSSDYVVQVYRDRSGIYWIATWTGNVDKYDPHNQNFTTYRKDPDVPNSLSDNTVNAVLEDRNHDIWFSTLKGLNRLDRKSGAFDIYTNSGDKDSLDCDYIMSTFEDSSGDFWVSVSAPVLIKFDRQKGKVIRRYPAETESFTKIIEDPKNPDILWLGARLTGFTQFNKKTETFTYYKPDETLSGKGPSNGFLHAILHDKEEPVIWLGGMWGGGLNKFDKRTGMFTYYRSDSKNPDSLSADAVADLCIDSSGFLWIGTKGGGLNRFNKKSETFEHIAKEKLPSDINTIIEDDDGYLWLSTNEGIVKFNTKTGEVDGRYDKRDGLQGDVFLFDSGTKTSDGELWFGGTQGISSFYPAKLTRNTFAPPIVLISLTQGGNPIGEAFDGDSGKIGAIRLDWKKNFFEFQFAALNYTIPEKNQYKYMLMGLDRQWYDAGTQRTGRYSGLRGGEYTLRIAGSNNDGVWNQDGISLKIKVQSPFWKTLWFYILCAVAVVAVFSGFYRMKIAQLRAEKASAKSLSESERNLREAQRIAHMGNWIYDSAGRITWSDEMYRIYGVSPGSFTPNMESFIRLTHPEDRPAMQDWIEACLDGKNIDDLEVRTVLPDGTVRFINSRCERLLDDEGQPSHLACTAQDITERKLAEAKHEQLIAAIEQAGEIVLITDTGGSIEYVNPAFEVVTGYAAQEVLGKNPRILKSGKHDKAFYRDLWETVSGGRIWRGQIVNKRKDGIFYTDSTTISPVRDDSGRIINYVAVKRDITEHLRISEEKAELEEQLRQAQKLESIGQLAGGVAHDFNNMLTIILGYGENLFNKLHHEDPLRKDVEEILDSGRRSALLTRQLLAFSRKQTMQPEVLNLNDIVRSLEKMLHRLIGEDIEMELKLSRDLDRVMADPSQIQQVIMNLAVNARDAMPDGGKLIIETANVELDEAYEQKHSGVKPGKHVMLAVTDTGVGMEKDVLSQIFDPFFTTKEKWKGTGLGLSTVYGIVKQSDGDIWVYSEPGKGTTFKIYLPQTEAEQEAIKEAAEKVEKREAENMSW